MLTSQSCWYIYRCETYFTASETNKSGPAGIVLMEVFIKEGGNNRDRMITWRQTKGLFKFNSVECAGITLQLCEVHAGLHYLISSEMPLKDNPLHLPTIASFAGILPTLFDCTPKVSLLLNFSRFVLDFRWAISLDVMVLCCWRMFFTTTT